MATIDYASKYPEQMQNLVDERFATEAKSNALVNQAFDFVGAKTVKLYDVSTAEMNDYQRGGTWRYGNPDELNATVEEYTMTQDKAFTFTIDKLNKDESKQALEAGSALRRQLRERVVPMIDTYRFDKMAAEAGLGASKALTKANIFEAFLDATVALDDAEVPLEGRNIVVTPSVYKLIKESNDIILETEIGQEARLRGVVGMIDGMEVIRVPKNRIGTEKFGFMVAHSVATTAPVKLAEYKIHEDAPGISGSLVEGRVAFDAFVRKNKADAIYVHINAAGE